MDDEPTARGENEDGDEQSEVLVADATIGSDGAPETDLTDGSLIEDDYDEDDPEGLGDLDEDDTGSGSRNALPRRVESWRRRSATGAIATAMAMGLQQVFEPERRKPAAMAEAPSDPYSDDDPITVDYVPDDAMATTVHVKPWLLDKDGSV